jgi:hypothetical protein
MTTTYLGLATVPTNTTNPSVPVNNAIAAFDAAIAGVSTLTLADADATLTSAQVLTSVLVLAGTLTAARTLTLPAAFPLVVVKNGTTQTLTLKKAGQAGVTLAAAAIALIYSGATDVGKL